MLNEYKRAMRNNLYNSSVTLIMKNGEKILYKIAYHDEIYHLKFFICKTKLSTVYFTILF